MLKRDDISRKIFFIQLDELAIVLFGSHGSGKSSTGNSILGSKHSKIGPGTIAITTQVETESVRQGNVLIRVTDTPGLQKPSDFLKIKDDIDRTCLKNHPTGNVTYAVVIQVGRFTTEERQIIEEIFKKYRTSLKNTIIIFTNREELDDEDNPDDRLIDGWLRKNPSLMALIQTYKLKYVAFQNKRLMAQDNDKQVRKLISVICEEDQAVSYCPVSDSKKEQENLIYVSKELMGEKFGTYGNEFFDDQFTIQKNIHDCEML